MMDTVKSWMGITLLGNSLAEWTAAALALITALLVLYAVRYRLLRRLQTLARNSGSRAIGTVTEIAANTRLPFLLVLSIFAGAQLLDLPVRADRIITAVIVIALIVQGGLWGSRALRLGIDQYLENRGDEEGAAKTTTIVAGYIGQLLLWSVVLLMLLDNLGFDITTLVASLGIGGIAVALAAQNILGDIFASLSIVIDRPFVIGDFIIVDDQKGTVEYIGLKTTRLRSLSGEQIIFANTDLLKSRVRNYKRMNERRVLFRFGVIYQTTADQLEMIPALVREIIEARNLTRFDRVHFAEFGDSSLDFEVVYYVLDRDYNLYMDIQQAINLALFRRLAEEGIEFAYPTRTLYVNRQGD
jgi:small-conductance mechanosensitive channel